ncbi:MAG: AAA family ATPase [Candidatus Hodarchaeales archaeon]
MTVVATIADGFQEDYAKSIGRISNDSILDLNLNENEIIEIINGDRRIGIFIRPIEEVVDNNAPQRSLYLGHKQVGPSREKSDIILHINGFLRSSLKVGLGQKVRIDKTSCPDAEKVLLTVLSPEDKEKIYFDYLTSRPIIRGQIIELQNISYDLKVAILKTSPPGIVRIGVDTDVRIAHEIPKDLLEDGEDSVMYDDIGGNNEILTRLRALVEFPLRYPEIFEMLNIHPPQGILITGPPGIGKTYISKAIACESGVTRFFVMAPEFVKGWWTAEKDMEKYFQHVLKYQPAILIIDQLEVLAPAPIANLSDLERRLTDQLIKNLDKVIRGKNIVVIATTIDAKKIHPSLLVYGRFEIEINLSIPNLNDRVEILNIFTRGIPFKNVDLNAIAQATGGYTPADLELLVKEAGMHALERRNLLDLEIKETIPIQPVKSPAINVVLENEDFIRSLSTTKPSATREIISQIPKVTWGDIGGLEEVQQSIKEMVEWPIKHPDLFNEMGIRAPKGVLLYGPPGTGKTLIAKALANEIQANFLVVKGPELLSKWFAESARMIRDLFRRARQLAPSIIFFDEIDAIAGPRGGSFSSEGSRERDRVINQLLASLDGVERMKDVFIIGATNRPNAIDPALLRPGRLDRLIYVPVPNVEGRLRILEVHTREMPLDNQTVDLKYVAEITKYYTGADLENLCREAAYAGLRRDFSSRLVTGEDFKSALNISRPTITPEIIRFYKVQDGEMKKHKTIDYSKFSQEFR